MDIAKLTMESKNIEYEKLIWQNEISDDNEAMRLKQNGYSFVLPESLFKEFFSDIPTECICYSYGCTYATFYWNKKTMAAANITFHLIRCLQNPNDHQIKKELYDKISVREAQVANKEYKSSIFDLEGELRFEYFNLLCENNVKVQGLYRLFFDVYNGTDYGFNRLKKETFEWVINSKTDKEKVKTVELIKSLPDVLTIYRGQTEGVSVPEENSYSWTTDIRSANFFATRLGTEDAEIIVAEIHKDKILELIDNRAEKEIIVRYEDVEIKDRIAVWGIDKIIDILPEVYEKLEEYEDYIDEFEFISDIHGKLHTQRVLLHILILCHLMNVSEEEINILCQACVYHDTGRRCDGIDDSHGRTSKEIYEDDVNKPLPIVSFLIEYHSLPDELGYIEIDNNPKLRDNKEMVTRLYKIFKDADGLDRVRLDLKDLDLNYLRTDHSKHLTKIARIFLDRAKMNKRYI